MKKNLLQKTAIATGLLSLTILSGCFSAGEQVELTDTTTPYSLEYVQNSEKVIVEEFSDIECPACKGFSSVYERVQADFPQVEFRYYHYPLQQIHDFAFPAALATECAGVVGGEEAREAYLHSAFNKDKLSTDYFRELAVEQGLNEEEFNICFNDKQTSDIVKKHMAEGNARDLSATPTLFFNGEKVTGGMNYDQMYAKIEKLLKEKGE